MHEGDQDTLLEMKESIERIEEQALLLSSLGRGVPTVEKNTGAVLSSIYVLTFGISDVVDVQDAQGGRK